mgnify:CR=1 FL=1
MYCVKKVKEDLFWVGGTDRRLALFENAYPIPRGVSYNAYLLLDEKTVLLMLISIINLYFLTKPLHSMVIEQDESFTESYLRQVLDILLRGIEVKDHDKT